MSTLQIVLLVLSGLAAVLSWAAPLSLWLRDRADEKKRKQAEEAKKDGLEQ